MTERGKVGREGGREGGRKEVRKECHVPSISISRIIE